MDGKLPLKANLELEGRGSLRVATLWSPKITL